MDGNDIETNLGISRRTLMKRGAIVGGTLMWAAPIVQSFNSPAFGQTSGTVSCVCEPTCSNIIVIMPSGPVIIGHVECTFTTDQCNCACC